MITKINKGIVLQTYIFEDEHIVKLLTEGGNVLQLKAKGLDSLTSKNRISLQVFNTVEVEYFTNNDMNMVSGRLKTAHCLKEFKGLDNERNLSLVEVIRNIILDQNSNSILTYSTLDKIISHLEIGTYKFQHLYSLFIITLRQNGYTPVIDRCSKCGDNQNIKGFEIYEGGLICEKHQEANDYKLPARTLVKIIEINSLKNPIECRDLDFTQEEVKQITSMYKMFLENQMGINLFMLNRV